MSSRREILLHMQTIHISVVKPVSRAELAVSRQQLSKQKTRRLETNLVLATSLNDVVCKQLEG
jgi:hypothetical protein